MKVMPRSRRQRKIPVELGKIFQEGKTISESESYRRAK